MISAQLASELDHFERLPPAAHGSQARRGAARRDHALDGPQLHPVPARHAQREGNQKWRELAGVCAKRNESAHVAPDSFESRGGDNTHTTHAFYVPNRFVKSVGAYRQNLNAFHCSSRTRRWARCSTATASSPSCRSPRSPSKGGTLLGLKLILACREDGSGQRVCQGEGSPGGAGQPAGRRAGLRPVRQVVTDAALLEPAAAVSARSRRSRGGRSRPPTRCRPT